MFALLDTVPHHHSRFLLPEEFSENPAILQKESNQYQNKLTKLLDNGEKM
jgi:hypothetical protein